MRGQGKSGDIHLKIEFSRETAEELTHKQWNVTSSNLSSKVKGTVSKQKRRYKSNGYDLDLSYITDRIIAMGFPSSHFEGVYRNNMKEVRRFLDERHRGCYKVNLFTHISLTHSHSLCHSLTHSLTHSLFHSLTHSLTRSVSLSLTRMGRY